MDDRTNTVRLLGESLEVGDSTKSRCPVCDGGSGKESSFSVTRDATGLLYNCYRSSCNSRGFVPDTGYAHTGVVKTPELRKYTHPVRELETKDEDYFYQRFELVRDSSRGYISRSDRGEYIFPIYNHRGLIRGYTIRQPLWAGSPAPRKGSVDPKTPKARTLPHVAEPMQSFYAGSHGQYSDRNRPLVVVEDQLSAIKVAQAGADCVALLGTTVNTAKVREWSTWNPSEVILALDADATGDAFKIARRWKLAFKNFRVAILLQDLKDEPIDDILCTLGIEE